MNKFLFSMFAVATWLVALAEPCVLEKGYKPFAKQSVDEVASLLGELSLETPAEPQAVTPAPQTEPIEPQVEQPQVVTPEPQAAETPEPEVEPPQPDASVTNAELQAEKHLPKNPAEKKLPGRPAKITSDTTVYP